MLERAGKIVLSPNDLDAGFHGLRERAKHRSFVRQLHAGLRQQGHSHAQRNQANHGRRAVDLVRNLRDEARRPTNALEPLAGSRVESLAHGDKGQRCQFLEWERRRLRQRTALRDHGHGVAVQHHFALPSRIGRQPGFPDKAQVDFVLGECLELLGHRQVEQVERHVRPHLAKAVEGGR